MTNPTPGAPESNDGRRYVLPGSDGGPRPVDDTRIISDHPAGPASHGYPQQGAGQPLPYAQPAASTAPAQPAPAPDGRGKGGMFAAAGTSALLAAALASAGTYGVVKAADSGDGGTTSTGNTTVIKADPAQFADAGTVNWAATAAKVNPSVVSITVSSGSSGGEGSGVILDETGNIVTNNHVVSGAGENAEVDVTLNNNRTYKASVVGKDPSTDLAVIRIKDVPSLTPIELGDDSKLVVGQPVMAVGNPLGLAGTVTTGIVSALDRPVTTSDSEAESPSSTSNSTVVTNAIQTSAAINPGNSGGALVDGRGKLIGINSSIASLSRGEGSSSQGGNIGIGFAIPTQVVKNISTQLIKKGQAEHALLGIATQGTEVSNGKATLTAAKVSSVSAGSGAAKAGLRAGDAIISIDGEPVTSANSLVGQVRSRTVGSTVKLTLIRDGKQRDVQVTLGAQPKGE